MRNPPTLSSLLSLVGILAVVVVGRDAQAQVPVHILVRDSASAPIPEAEVYLESTKRRTRTSGEGKALLTMPEGTHTIVVRKLGMRPFIGGITVSADRTDTLQVVLGRGVTQLSRAEIRARPNAVRTDDLRSMDDFWERRVEGKGRTFTRQEIEKYGSVRAVIATVPGARLQLDAQGNVRAVYFPRCGTNAKWYVDGMRIGTEPSSEVAVPDLRMAPPVRDEPPFFSDEDIEAIEVYRGPSQLPAVAVGNSCAAIFIWTRRSK